MSIAQVSGSAASMALGLLHLKSNKVKASALPKAAATTATNGTTNTTGTTGTTGTTSSTSSMDSTFLSLLTDELQNQDPSAPMDSTAMVGQMISLNQLDQLISINSAVGGSATTITGAAKKAATAASTGAAEQTAAAPGSAATMAARAALLARLGLTSASASTTPFSMNPALSAAAASNVATQAGTAPLDLSHLTSNFGAR